MRKTVLLRTTSIALTATFALFMTSCSAKPSTDTVETTAEEALETGTEETEAETKGETEEETSEDEEDSEDVTEEETLTESEEEESTEEETEDSPESKTNAASESEEEEEIEEESTNSKTSEKDSTKSETTTSETTTEAVTVQSVSAVVNGTHYVGETLTGADFTVTVKMSDGETLTNPAGWSAQPLTLNSTSNLITVAYEGASVTITVNASVQTASDSGSSSATSTTSTTTSATTQATTASTTASATVYSFDSVEGTFQYSTSGTGLASKTPYYFYVTDSSYWDCTYKVGDTINVTDIVASLWYYTDDGGYAVYNMTDSQKQKITLNSYNVSSLEGERITATYEGMSFTTTVTAYEGLVDKSYAIEAFNTFNEWRAEAGLSQLIWSDELYEIACIRAEELSTNFSHEEDFLPGAINAIGYNVASLIDGWKNSAPHYAFIMADYEEYYWAVAFYKTGGTYTGTGIFTNSYDTISSGRYLIRDADV